MNNYTSKNVKNKIGKLIANKRNSLNISQEFLSEKTGIHERTLSKLENGHSFFSAETLCKLCNFFNVPPKTFFEIEETKSINEEKLNAIIEKLRQGRNEKIDLYFNIINLIDTRYDR